MKNLFVLLPLVLLFQSCGFEIVDEGNIGIKKNLGKVIGGALEPGLHFYNPFTVGITELSIREKKWEEKALAYTKDLQNVSVSFTLNYRPLKANMVSFYKEFGEGYANKIIPQIVFARIKEIVGTFEAGPLVEKRPLASDTIKGLLIESLGKQSITVTNFEITNLDYNDAFEQAVEAKVIAKETAIEEQNRTVQVKEQAAQRVLKAKAEAQAIEIKARALAKNKDLIQLEAVKRWDGKLPKMTLGGAMPFINVNGLQK